MADQAEHGKKISWADTIILTGQCGAGVDGVQTFGLRAGVRTCGSRRKTFYWGSEGKWLADERYSGDRELAQPSGGGADGADHSIRRATRDPDPLAAARDIRRRFRAWQ